jgi:hypothetical protein
MSRSLRVGRILIAVHNGPEVIPVCLALHIANRDELLSGRLKKRRHTSKFRKPRLSDQARRYLPLSRVCASEHAADDPYAE